MIGLIDRLKEPSTYAGIAGAFAALGILDLDEGAWNTIFGAVAAIAAAAAVIIKERGM